MISCCRVDQFEKEKDENLWRGKNMLLEESRTEQEDGENNFESLFFGHPVLQGLGRQEI